MMSTSGVLPSIDDSVAHTLLFSCMTNFTPGQAERFREQIGMYRDL